MTQSQVPTTASNYRGLLAIVILLGMAIMLGVGALIGAAYMASGRPREAGANGVRANAAAPASGEPFLATLAAPGQHIESAELRDGRLLVRLTGPRGDEMVLIDAASGAVTGRVVLAPNP